MIVYGTRLLGKVDEVPGLFHVATRFFHVSFLPLFPTSSWIIVDGSKQSGIMSSSWSGLQLPTLSWSSIGTAWLRTLLIYGAGALVYLAFATGHEGPPKLVAPLLMALLCVAAFFYSYRLNRMTLERIEEFAQTPGVPRELVTHAKRLLSQ